LDVAVDKHPWVADENTLKPLERVGVRRLLEVLLKPEVRNDPVGQLAILMIDTLSPNDFTTVITQEWTVESTTPAISLWKALPEVAGYSSTLINSLSGPGTHIVALTKQCAVFGEDIEIGALVVTALIKMLGAKEVTVLGDQCRGVYSLNPFMLEAVLGTISEFDPKDPMRAVRAVIPVIDSHLSDWLREKLSIKQSKDGVLKQVVPGIHKLKNKYELLWDQKSPEGYLKIMAVLQKFIDQAISVNTSYNPRHYEDEKIPMSEMIKHILMHYKYGGKTLYYFNTFDGAGEIEENKPLAQGQLDDEDCDSCKI
jgi:hypothetical protein